MLLESYLSFSVVFLAVGIGLSTFELITRHRIQTLEKYYGAGKTITASLFDSFFQQLLSRQLSKVVIGTRCIGALGLITSVLFHSFPVLCIALAITICSYALSPYDEQSSNHTYLVICTILFLGLILSEELPITISLWVFAFLPIVSHVSNGFTNYHQLINFNNILAMAVFSLFWTLSLPYAWFVLGAIIIYLAIYILRNENISLFWALTASFPGLIYCRMLIE